MFAQKLVLEARQHAAALKAALVAMYGQLQDGKLTAEERDRLGKAVAEIRGKLEAETRRLGGQPEPPAEPKAGNAQ